MTLTVGDSVQFDAGKLYEARVLQIAAAICAGEIDGEIYSDGEVWASEASHAQWLTHNPPRRSQHDR